MSGFTQAIQSSILRKVVMALTGLFLILFLVVHLLGNLQLLIDDGGKTFNLYAHLMGNNPFIQLVSKGNFAFIILHVIFSLILTRMNSKARPIGYRVSGGNTNSTFVSRNMGILGTLILIFLIVHLKGFWWEFKYGDTFKETITIDGSTIPNYYLLIQNAYNELWYVIFYGVSMVFLSFHLWHGFSSAFQTLGINHEKYTPAVQFIGKAFSIIVPFLFAIIPIVMYFKR
ncbi:MAG: succinate dehydrogenase cytochrome b subunit [Chitinophagaceae bacterium]|nr:succinate dehydrogenase cytochrome b subunit [Chitinophagaceae bacterium]